MSTNTKKKYNKMDQLSHIIHRPDTYVGSVRTRVNEEFVSHMFNNFKIKKSNVKYSPAILRIFIEPLSNAIDNVSRSRKSKTKCTKIKVNVDINTGRTTIWNDGEIIPIEFDDDEDCYNHTLIFGNLLTSSNYDDDEERFNISGRNGLGVKLTNVFSKEFSVSGGDPENNKSFYQKWTNNMKVLEKPEIKKYSKKNGYTEVSWIPDFSLFKIKGYTDDIINLYCKYVVDTAMLTNLDVYFNDTLIPVKNLLQYSQLYLNIEENNKLYIKIPNTQVVVMPSSHFQQISFVNGVHTSLGGTHIDSWVKALFKPICEKISKNGNTFTVKEIKKFFMIFVDIKIVNPEFESQSKHKLESPVTANVKKTYINSLMKWSVIDDIKRSKELSSLKKLERNKKNFIKIEGLDPANNEGVLGSECTLILVEGLAAKTYAVKGIDIGAFGKRGRDWFGIYALRGKVLNVRNAQTSSISKNKVISDIIKALGAKLNVDYTLDKIFKTLRYGKIMIITDADVDGIHISGLLQNMIHTMFPTLLERYESFITSMQTPIVRVFLKNKKQKLFYDEREYKSYVTEFSKNNPNKKIVKKYYKGLGSSSDKDIRDTFGNKMIEYKNDEYTNFNMNKVFSSKNADARKVWLQNYDNKHIVLKWNEDKKEVVPLNISDFLNTEMIKFSLDDCKRSIPCLLDGLKESNRKALYACFLRNLKYTGKSLKVVQLAGYVAEKTSYHHGEQNLYETITRMANCYPGSNNIPLFYRDGQFGTRLSGGKDAANARYIFTKLDALTRLLFRQEDDCLLENIIDAGDAVEPRYYVPILPTILINGCTIGIGTGWSSSVPCYNPLDLINSVKNWLKHDGKVILNDGNTTVSLLPEIHPWYRGFTGKIEQTSDSKYTSWGNVTTEKNTKVVNELPIGLWIDNFKDFLDSLQESKKIKSVKNYSTPTKIKFVIKEHKNGILCNKNNLKLYKYIYTSNMVLFDKNGNIKKYTNVDEIINEYCEVRFDFYKKRKKHQLESLDYEIKFLGNKKRFLEDVMKGIIKLFEKSGKTKKSRKTVDIINELEKRGYDRIKKSPNKNKNKDNDEDDENENKLSGYEYLLRLQFRSITEENIDKLKNDIDSNIKIRDKYKNTSEKDMWINDLNEFEKEYKKWLKIMEKN